MAVTVEQAAQFGGLNPAEPMLPALLTAANAMVSAYLRPSGESRIPSSVRDLAVMTLTGELWKRRNSPGGIPNEWGGDGDIPRLANDPMKPVYAMLRPYRGVGAVG